MDVAEFDPEFARDEFTQQMLRAAGAVGRVVELAGIGKSILAEALHILFMLTAPPLRLPGAVGSPVTPVATV